MACPGEGRRRSVILSALSQVSLPSPTSGLRLASLTMAEAVKKEKKKRKRERKSPPVQAS